MTAMRIWLSRPHLCGREREMVDRAFDSGFVAPIGPQLDAFEAAVGEYLGDGVSCVGVASGTAALHLALRISGVQAGDEVWLSSMTFAGGVFPVTYLGAVPVFLDLDPESWTMSPDLTEEALAEANRLNRLPAAIVATDLYGHSVDLDRFEAMAARYGVRLIIDSAESLGARWRGGRKCGTGGEIAILSFNGNKIITTGGGGMLVSRDRGVTDTARFLSTQARDQAPHYEHSTIGYNYRLGNVPAAIGLAQMEVLDQRVDARRAIAARYRSALSRSGVAFMPEVAGTRGSHWLSVAAFDQGLLATTREAIRRALLAERIESRPVWKPMHMQPVFRDTRYIGRGMDERLFRDGLCLPSGSDLSVSEQDEVIELIRRGLDSA